MLIFQNRQLLGVSKSCLFPHSCYGHQSCNSSCLKVLNSLWWIRISNRIARQWFTRCEISTHDAALLLKGWKWPIMATLLVFVLIYNKFTDHKTHNNFDLSHSRQTSKTSTYVQVKTETVSIELDHLLLRVTSVTQFRKPVKTRVHVFNSPSLIRAADVNQTQTRSEFNVWNKIQLERKHATVAAERHL